MPEVLQQTLLWAPPVLLAVILHEIAHGWVAERLGDPTARLAGRLTLNPLPHVDPVGTVLLPILLVAAGSPFVFGWARPVPVSFAHLRNPRRDMVKVALAGPLTNVLLAVASAAAFRLVGGWHAQAGGIAEMALASVQINIVLAVLNLVPILPLDGGRVVAGLLPRDQAMRYARLEPYGMFILMALLFSGTLNHVLGPVRRLLLHALL